MATSTQIQSVRSQLQQAIQEADVIMRDLQESLDHLDRLEEEIQDEHIYRYLQLSDAVIQFYDEAHI